MYNYQDIGIDGWMAPAELQFLFEKATEMNSILEIGSWKGRSTHALLSGCKGSVTAVDHFKGSLGEDYAHAEAKGEDEPVYQEFMKNVGEFTNLKVLKMSSKEAKQVLGDKKFDMIFIDGEHTYEGVKEDIALWKDNATILLCGHDYVLNWPGVMKAVDESLEKNGIHASIWYKDMTKKGWIELFREKIKSKEAFSFIKRGDGEEACMNGDIGENCDHHNYSVLLGDKLKEAYSFFESKKNCFVPLFNDQYFFNTLLHRVDKNNSQVKLFYQAIKEDNRNKIFVGPEKLGIVAKLLEAEHIIVPELNAFNFYNDILKKIKSSLGTDGNEIIMFSAGMMSKPMIMEILKTGDRTCLDLGSAFDSFISQTRTNQMSQAEIVLLYLDFIVKSF